MYIPDFDYYNPATLEEACGLLTRLGADAKLLAGGTDLVSKMKNGLIAPKAVVSLTKIKSMAEIAHIPGRGVVIGARATHNDLVNSKVLLERYPSVCEAAHSMANNQIRNRGTVGGNLVNALPSADLPPILIALGAYVGLVGTKGNRSVPLEKLFLGPQRTVVAADEILTQITIPDQSTTGSAYLKFGLRHSGALAVVGAAASVVAAGAYIKEARIVLGAVGPTPMRAKKAEQCLAGRIVTDEVLEEAGLAAAMECKPISDMRASEEYRRDMVRVFTKRALRQALHLEQALDYDIKEGDGSGKGGNGNGTC